MGNRWRLIASIFQLAVGLVGIITATVVGFRDENTAKWVVTLILSIAFIALGIVGIFDYKSKR